MAPPERAASPPRRRRGLLRLLPLLAFLALACGGGPRLPANTDILLITIDTLRADRLGAYGHARAVTPTMDALAAEGMLFEQATTPFPRTTPALASLLSGLWPHHHGSREVGQRPKEISLLPELLRQGGYFTAGLSANGAAGRNQGLDRGFDLFLDAGELRAKRAAQVTEHALELAAKAPADKPLFLWVHYIDPHYPYQPPAEWPLPENSEACRAMMQEVAGKKSLAGLVFSDRDGRASKARESCLALYDSEIAYLDHHLGRLLADLRKQRSGDALTILTADHGENLGEEGLFYQHGPNLHDASLRVPLILHGPGVAPGRDSGVARLEDLMPTLLSLLAIPRSTWPSMDGLDFSPRLQVGDERGGDTDRLSYAESGSALMVQNHRYLHSGRARELHCLNARDYALCGRPGEEPGLFDHRRDPDLTHDLSAERPWVKKRLLAARRTWPVEQARERSVRSQRFKLVERPLLQGGYRSSLYDLQADPLAENDVRSKFPAEATRLQASLDAWTADLPSFRVPERKDEELEALRALGYIQ